MTTAVRRADKAFAAWLVVCVCLLWPGAAVAERRIARPSDAFVDSVGVNTHLHYQGTVYDVGFDTVIKPKLLASGIRHVRDGAYTYPGAGPGTFYYQRCRALAAEGVRFDLITDIAAPTTQATDYGLLADVRRWCGGAVESFEGVNEPDLRWLPAGYPDWLTATVAAQQALHAAVKGSTATGDVAVVGPSVVWSPHAVGDLSPYLDFGNWHPYPGGECPTCGDVYGQSLDTFEPSYRLPSAGKPLIATETGYHNAIHAPGGGHRPVSELAAGKYLPRLLLEYFNRGFARTYLYEFIDAYPDAGRTEPDANFGLLRNDGSEKPAFRAVRSLLQLLRDPGEPFVPGSLDLTLSGETSQVDRTLLQKRDGTFLLALWLERSSYDTGARPNAPDDLGARGDLAVADQAVTLTFDGPDRPATVHGFQDDGRLASFQATLSSGKLSVRVSDRVTVVELPPAVAGPAPPLGDEPGGSPVVPTPGDGQPPTAERTSNQVPQLKEVRLVRRRERRRTVAPASVLRCVLSEPGTVEVAIERIAPRRGGGARSAPSRAQGQLIRTLHSQSDARRHSIVLPTAFVRRLQAGRYRLRVTLIGRRGARSESRFVTWRVIRPQGAGRGLPVHIDSDPPAVSE